MPPKNEPTYSDAVGSPPVDTESFPPDFIIPASGSIVCRTVLGELWIQQDDAKVLVKYRQLVALIEWLRGQEKALRAMGVLS